MTSVCFYFQVHQPYRLREAGPGPGGGPGGSVFDHDANAAILRKVAEKCYRPATRLLLNLVRRHQGHFRISYSISGTALDQLEAWAPDVLEMFQRLAETGACEFLAETSHHSLSFLFSRGEFDAQVDRHRARVRELFGTEPTVFRNTELTYSNDLGRHLAGRDLFRAVLCEGVDWLLRGRTPNDPYAPLARRPGERLAPATVPFVLLLKNYRLSDDIAFRFSDRNWDQWPLSADTFADWVDRINLTGNGSGHLCNLFMDYETLGEHQWHESGIFQFLEDLPDRLLRDGRNDFRTPSEAAEVCPPVDVYDVPTMTSWADTERDLTAWLGNPMQDDAVAALYRLEPAVRERAEAGDEAVLEDWRKLTTSDHVYYMCTKFWADGDVHTYFSPYDSPYQAYVTFMNALQSLERRVGVRRTVTVGA